MLTGINFRREQCCALLLVERSKEGKTLLRKE